MGAQESANKRPREVIEVDQEISHNAVAYNLWTHIHPAIVNRKNPCTVFIKQLNSDEAALKYFENGIKLLKQLKHPNILKFVEGACTANDVSLITERVQMLDLSITSLSIVEVQCGLRHILEALLFLHNKAFLSHNNVCPSSVFVCSNGEWKLGGFEFATPPSLAFEYTHTKFCTSTRMEEFVPSEDEKCSGSSDYFSSDAFGFGKLIYYVIGKFDENNDAVQNLRELAADLSTADRAARLPLSSALDHPALSNDLTDVINFCNTIHLKESAEKTNFYGSVVARLRSLPCEVVAKRLCRLLLSRYVLLEPKSHSELYPQLLVPSEDGEGILPRECYNAYMVPELVRLFNVREPPVRIALLSFFDRIAPYIPHERLRGFVRDEIVQGCYDSDSNLVSFSLRALATLVDILGVEAVCPWQIANKFGTRFPQQLRPIKHVVGISYPRLDSTSTLENTKMTGLEKQRVVQTSNTEICVKEKSDWGNDMSWSGGWDKCEMRGAAVNHGPASVSEVKHLRLSKPLKLHSPLSKKTSAPVYKKTSVIGSEFEISIMPQKSIEDDLFADLAPKLPAPPSLEDQFKALQTSTNMVPPVFNVLSKFAMVEAVDDAVCWDENEDISIASTDSVSTNGASNPIDNEDND